MNVCFNVYLDDIRCADGFMFGIIHVYNYYWTLLVKLIEQNAAENGVH